MFFRFKLETDKTFNPAMYVKHKVSDVTHPVMVFVQLSDATPLKFAANFGLSHVVIIETDICSYTLGFSTTIKVQLAPLYRAE